MFYKYFHLSTKEGKDSLFIPNKAQVDFHKNKTNRNIILKARQLGFSTLIKLEDLEAILTQKNTDCLTIADTVPNAQKIFDKIIYAWLQLPVELRNLYKERFRSANQLYLDSMFSGIRVATTGRSGTIQRLHISEFSKFTQQQVLETLTGSMPAVPKDGEITIESTARGMNHFKDFWDKAEEKGYKKFFYNWTWADEYQEKPVNEEFKRDYKELASNYKLIENVQERFNLTDAQFYWYYLQARGMGELIKQEYPLTPEESFLSTGLNVFNLQKVLSVTTKPPISKFEDVVNIWEEPVSDKKYIIGIDTSEGLGGDRSTMELIDGDVNQIGEFKSANIEPHELSYLAVKLAKRYNGAYIIAERNASGLTTVTKIMELGYNRQYMNRSVDKITQKTRNELGWRTTATNRDIMIDEYLQAFEEGRLGLKSKDLIEEMMTFVRKDNGKREHEDGKHDDLLFAFYLAIQGLKYYRLDEIRTFQNKPLGF